MQSICYFKCDEKKKKIDLCHFKFISSMVNTPEGEKKRDPSESRESVKLLL